jgi:hypothetical protein
VCVLEAWMSSAKKRGCEPPERGSGASSSVPTRPCARRPIAEVTTKGRPDPASAAPIASIASLSVSPAAAMFEKS